VGNLVGEATVDVVPRIAGRLESVRVRLGDRVTMGQEVAKVEDREIREQVNQSEANIAVNEANIKARENDLRVAQSALDRARTGHERGILSTQGLEDAEARYQSAQSQVTVAKAQLVSTQARLDELRIALSNTRVLSPVDGFVGRRALDSGAFAGANTVILSVVDLSTVRLVANIVEKDFKRVQAGAQAVVEVDAFPGEQFTGKVSRVAPVFDPATRTATMEIEIPNPGFRLKPGMYARVRVLAERRTGVLAVPRAAIVDTEGRRGVFVVDNDTAKFREVRTGLADADWVEVLDGVEEGTRLVTTGALAIRDGDRVTVAGAARGDGQRGGKAAAAAAGVPRARNAARRAGSCRPG
jgi:RND family efflux transporter MFP subunit